MGKPGRPKKITEPPIPSNDIIVRNEQKEVERAAETAEAETTKKETLGNSIPPATNIATGPCWRYHASEEPRMFNKGDTIPAGWGDKDLVGWTTDTSGFLHKIEG